jgi:glycosyltransferase involved in cell wall biosynthesis
MEVLRLWSKTGVVQMDFLLTSGNKGIFDDEAASLGAKLHYVTFGKRTLVQFRREFRQILRQGRYHAVHDHQDYASGWHFLLGGRALPPIRVTHVHNPSYQILNNYGVSASRRLTARLGKYFISRFATHIAGTSRQVVTEYGFDQPRFQHLPKAALHCGFDPARFGRDRNKAHESVRSEFGWPSNAKIILFAGRIDRSADLNHPQNHKNSGFASELAMAAAQRDRQIHSIFAGKPSSASPILTNRASAAGVEGQIKFLGIRHDIEHLMLGSDMLLFPSRGEGLGMVAVEAQAAGLPVLASTAVPRECVVVENMVRFLDLSDDFPSWLQAINETLAASPTDPILCNTLVSKSPFAIRNSSAQLDELYRSRMSSNSIPTMSAP